MKDVEEEGAVNTGTNLFVTGIHPRLTESDVSRMFEKYGEVESCSIMLDPHTKESRGFGFVKMITTEQAEAAKEALQGEVIEGRTLSIEKARRARPRTPTPGKYFGPPKRGTSSCAQDGDVHFSDDPQVISVARHAVDTATAMMTAVVVMDVVTTIVHLDMMSTTDAATVAADVTETTPIADATLIGMKVDAMKATAHHVNAVVVDTTTARSVDTALPPGRKLLVNRTELVETMSATIAMPAAGKRTRSSTDPLFTTRLLHKSWPAAETEIAFDSLLYLHPARTSARTPLPPLSSASCGPKTIPRTLWLGTETNGRSFLGAAGARFLVQGRPWSHMPLSYRRHGRQHVSQPYLSRLRFFLMPDSKHHELARQSAFFRSATCFSLNRSLSRTTIGVEIDPVFALRTLQSNTNDSPYTP